MAARIECGLLQRWLINLVMMESCAKGERVKYLGVDRGDFAPIPTLAQCCLCCQAGVGGCFLPVLPCCTNILCYLS